MKIAITGAQSFTGRYVAKKLLDKKATIVNLTNHPNRSWKLQSKNIIDQSLQFKREYLVNTLKGCDALVQTYWVRFDNTLGTFREAVTNNSKLLIDCAKQSGVKKIVFTSHTQTSINSPFPYIRQKAKVEQYLKNSGLRWGIVKPCAIFGSTAQESILINNIAYLVKRFPIYPMPGDGNYYLQFVNVDDMADLIVKNLESEQNYEVDAVGPDKVTFKEIVQCCAKVFNTPCYPVCGVNKKIIQYLTYPLNWYFNDILVDTHDLDLMTTGLTCSHDPPTGKVSLLKWIQENREDLGKNWISSIKRYYK